MFDMSRVRHAHFISFSFLLWLASSVWLLSQLANGLKTLILANAVCPRIQILCKSNKFFFHFTIFSKALYICVRYKFKLLTLMSRFIYYGSKVTLLEFFGSLLVFASAEGGGSLGLAFSTLFSLHFLR